MVLTLPIGEEGGKLVPRLDPLYAELRFGLSLAILVSDFSYGHILMAQSQLMFNH